MSHLHHGTVVLVEGKVVGYACLATSRGVVRVRDTDMTAHRAWEGGMHNWHMCLDRVAVRVRDTDRFKITREFAR